MRAKHRIPCQAVQQDPEEFSFSVPGQDGVELLVFAGEAHGEQQAVQPADVEVKDGQEGTKNEGQRADEQEEKAVHRFEAVDKDADRNGAEDVGEHHLSDVTNGHGHGANDPPFRRKEENPSAVFAQAIGCKNSPGKAAEYRFNGFPKADAFYWTNKSFPFYGFEAPVEQHEQEDQRKYTYNLYGGYGGNEVEKSFEVLIAAELDVDEVKSEKDNANFDQIR